jgi:hypothetical protein
MLSPAEHLRMLVELLQPAGPDLARRWVAALLAVARDDRAALVEEIERRVAARYGDDALRELHVRTGPVQRDGYIEEIETTYAPAAPAKKAPRQPRRKAR